MLRIVINLFQKNLLVKSPINRQKTR